MILCNLIVSDMQSFPCAVNWQQSKEEKLAVGKNQTYYVILLKNLPVTILALS